MREKASGLEGRGLDMRIPCEEQESLCPDSVQPLLVGESFTFSSLELCSLLVLLTCGEGFLSTVVSKSSIN